MGSRPAAVVAAATTVPEPDQREMTLFNKVNRMRLGTPEEEVAPLMTSQLSHYFQSTQAVHGADDITTLNFRSQVISLSICGPLFDTPNYQSRSKALL